MKTENELVKYIAYKLDNYMKAFDRRPDTILMTKEDYEIIKHNPIMSDLEVHFNSNVQPIIYKR